MFQSKSYYAIVSREEFNPELVQSAMKFRARLFYEQYGWDLKVKNGVERDQFDRDFALHTTLMCGDEIVGYFRAIQTTHPYLAETIFPDLAVTQSFPKRSDRWEISRFGVWPSGQQRKMSLLLYSLMFRVGMELGAKGLIAITDVYHERVLSLLGIRTRRYGPPRQIAHDRKGRAITVVAGEIPLVAQSDKTLNSMLANVKHMEIDYATQILRPERISA